MLKLPACCRTLAASCPGVLYATECSSLRLAAQGSAAADAVCGSHAGATLSSWQSLLVHLLQDSTNQKLNVLHFCTKPTFHIRFVACLHTTPRPPPQKHYQGPKGSWFHPHICSTHFCRGPEAAPNAGGTTNRETSVALDTSCRGKQRKTAPCRFPVASRARNAPRPKMKTFGSGIAESYRANSLAWLVLAASVVELIVRRIGFCLPILLWQHVSAQLLCRKYPAARDFACVPLAYAS